MIDLAMLWQLPYADWAALRDRWVPPGNDDDDGWPSWLNAAVAAETEPSA